MGRRWSDSRRAEWLRLCLWSVLSSTISTCPMAYLVSRTPRCRQRHSPRHVRPRPRTCWRSPIPPLHWRPSARITRLALSASTAQDLAQQNLIDGAALEKLMFVVRARGLFVLLSRKDLEGEEEHQTMRLEGRCLIEDGLQ